MSVATTIEGPPADVANAPAPRARPVQLALGIALLLVIVLPLSWLAWKQFGGPRQEDLTEVQPTMAARIMAGVGMNPRRPAEGVRAKPNGNGLVANAGDVHLDATKPAKAKQWNLYASYNRGDLISPQQNAALNARFRLPADAAYAKSLNVSPDQIKQLSAIPIGVQMPLSDDEKAKLAELCEGYENAKDKSPATTALIKQLESMGPIKLAATRQSAADRAAAIGRILTPQQLDAFKPK